MFQSSPVKNKQIQLNGRSIENASCIIDCGLQGSLYLGSIESANDIDFLQNNKIESILSICMTKIPISISSQMKYYEHYYLEDSEDENIYKYFDSAYHFIEKARSQGNILVHCMAGISRSATIIAAYLIKKHRYTYKEALNQLERKRWQIYPNDGFIKQLILYERDLNQQKLQTNEKLKNILNNSNNELQLLNEYSKIRKKYIDDKKQEELLRKSNEFSLQFQRKTQFQLLNKGIDLQFQKQQFLLNKDNLNQLLEQKQNLQLEYQEKKNALIQALNNKMNKVSQIYQAKSSEPKLQKQQFYKELSLPYYTSRNLEVKHSYQSKLNYLSTKFDQNKY